MAAPSKTPRTKSLLCPQCGGTVAIRGFEHTRNVVCIQCCSILDASTPSLQILQQFDEKLRVRPWIPLGTRGKIRDTLYETIGFQVRTITIEGIDYSWHEYLLFNPYKGFRYLTQYNGHWNDVVPIKEIPAATTANGRKAVAYRGLVFKHFQNATARTTFVMGEFPWAVRIGESAVTDDYVAPPYMLSSETSENETTWSHGEYLPGEQVWKAFGLNGEPPKRGGVFANQPSPYAGRVGGAWSTFLILLVAWAALLALMSFTARNEEAFRRTFAYDDASPGEHAIVTDLFELKGPQTNAQIILRTDLHNNWAYFNMALINEQTGQGYDFGREVSYYTGTDSDGAWSEGSQRDSVTIPRVPPGRYYLRIEPEMDSQSTPLSASARTMRYEVIVKRGVPQMLFLWLMLPLLLIPPLVISIQAGAFEGQRWQESDYAPVSSSDDEDDD